jgi:hypothetical protein
MQELQLAITNAAQQRFTGDKNLIPILYRKNLRPNLNLLYNSYMQSF